MRTLITYQGDGEILICTPETEPELLGEFFGEGNRNLEDYDREVRNGIIEISTILKIHFNN